MSVGKFKRGNGKFAGLWHSKVTCDVIFSNDWLINFEEKQDQVVNRLDQLLNDLRTDILNRINDLYEDRVIKKGNIE